MVIAYLIWKYGWTFFSVCPWLLKSQIAWNLQKLWPFFMITMHCGSQWIKSIGFPHKYGKILYGLCLLLKLVNKHNFTDTPVVLRSMYPSSHRACKDSTLSVFYFIFYFNFILGGSGIVGYVYVMEFIGKDHRGPVGIMIFISWILSLSLLSLFGYLLQSWRTLSIVTSVPGAFTILFWL